MKKNSLRVFSIVAVLLFVGCNSSEKRTAKNVDKKEVQPTENTASEMYAKLEVPVLCYHRITEGQKGDYTVTPETFSAHMKILADSGFHSISPAELYDYLVWDKVLPEKPILITFDDSRTEHSAIAAPVMEKYGFRGVFFIMTITYDKKNYMTKEEIAQLAKAGHTIGLHTWDHTMVSKFKDTTDWQRQIALPKAKLEKITGMPVDYFAYPNGVFNHDGAKGLSNYFKLSFILASKRDSIVPLQTVRRMIVPDWSAEGMLKSMRRTFKTN